MSALRIFNLRYKTNSRARSKGKPGFNSRFGKIGYVLLERWTLRTHRSCHVLLHWCVYLCKSSVIAPCPFGMKFKEFISGFTSFPVDIVFFAWLDVKPKTCEWVKNDKNERIPMEVVYQGVRNRHIEYQLSWNFPFGTHIFTNEQISCYPKQ